MYKPKVNLEQKEQKKEVFTDTVMKLVFSQQNLIISLLERLEEALKESERLVEENIKLKSKKLVTEDDDYIKMPELNIPDNFFDDSTKLKDAIWSVSSTHLATYPEDTLRKIIKNNSWQKNSDK